MPTAAAAAAAAPTTRRRAVLAAAPAALLGAALGACNRAAPVLPPLNGAFAGRATLAQREEQIRAAGASQGWRMDARGPGFTRAELDIRSHRAVVDISYDPDRYQIRYASSINLDYDGTTIHRNYNYWVQQLDQSIQRESAKPPPPAPPAPPPPRRRAGGARAPSA